MYVKETSDTFISSELWNVVHNNNHKTIINTQWFLVYFNNMTYVDNRLLLLTPISDDVLSQIDILSHGQSLCIQFQRQNKSRIILVPHLV